MRDPFKAEMDLFEKRCHVDEEGCTYIECNLMTEEEKILQNEKAKYIKAREEYITDRLFQDFGYSAILNRMKNKKYIPCDGADGQCHMDCHMNGECKYDQSRESS